jgi:hypothetical protein
MSVQALGVSSLLAGCIWDRNPLRIRETRRCIPASKTDHEIEIRNRHEDLAAISTRENRAHAW